MEEELSFLRFEPEFVRLEPPEHTPDDDEVTHTEREREGKGSEAQTDRERSRESL